MDNTAKRLLKYIIKQKNKILLGVLATLLMSLVELFTGSLLKFLINLIDKFSGSFAGGIDAVAKLPVKYGIKLPLSGEKFTIIKTTLKGADEIFKGMVVLCAVFIGLYFLLALFNYLRRVFMNAATQRILQNFKEDIYNKILRLPFSFFSSNRTGDVVSRITYDVTMLNEIIDLLIEVARASVYILVFIPVMFIMSWQLSLFTILFFPVSVILIEYITRKIKRVGKNITDNVGDYTAFLEEKINRYKLIKTYGKEHEESKIFTKLVSDNYKYNLKLIKLKYSLNPTNEFLGMLLLAVIYIFYSYKITHGSTSLGDIVFYLYLVKTLYKPVKKVAQAWGQLHIALVSTRKIFKLLDEPEENFIVKNKQKSLTQIETIEFKNVVFSYFDNYPEILNNISFVAQQGDIICISGKTGAGKSTLLKLLPQFFYPVKGEILINNQNYTHYALSNIRKVIKYVDTDINYLNGTIIDNLLYGGGTITDKQKHDFIKFLGLTSLDDLQMEIGKNGIDLSEGQKQKLSILRAVITLPQVLILDEVFTSLDDNDIHYIFDLCKYIPIVFIISRKNEVIKYVTKRYIISNGTILSI